MKGARVRAAFDWLRDSFRLIGGFVYWNTRKSTYVARDRRGRCPCQNPSDDNIPGRVRCDAVALWHRPERFRQVCPLLVRTEHGWCCSVTHREVRPFWGRALGGLGAMLLAAYLIGALAVWSGLRLTGRTPATFWQVAWPGKWSELRNVQADVFFVQALGALREGRVGEAYLALTSAQTRDNGHYPSAQLLAIFTMFQGSYLFADGLFERLIANFPEHRASTALAYHDTLLALGRLDRVAEFSLQMAVADREHSALWVRSMLVALHRQPDVLPRILAREAEVRALAPHAQLLLEGERALQHGGREEAFAVLKRRFVGGMNLVYMELQVARLAELGETNEAQALLDYYGPFMGEFDHALAQYSLDALAADRTMTKASLQHLLTLPLTPVRVERASARMIHRPTAADYRALHARVTGDAGLPSREIASAMWAAAVACGAEAEAAYWRTRGRDGGRELPGVTQIDYASRDLTQVDSVAHIVNVVHLPRAVVLTLMTKEVARPPRLFREGF